MRLTIGMAVYDDYDGVYFTVQALKMYHKEVLDRLEIIVVDNKPDSPGSPMIQRLLETWSKGVATRYIPMPESTGTTQPRNRVFSEASGDAVLCMDSHVLIWPGALARLLDYYTQHDSKDILSGPMCYDDLQTIVTHFDDSWRSEMWGIWGRAWGCNHSLSSDAAKSTLPPFVFSVHPGPHKNAGYFGVEMGFKPYTSCPVCSRLLPQIPYPAHEGELLKSGYVDMGWQDNPFPIPGMGLGLFTCRKDVWLGLHDQAGNPSPGFNQHFRGFGGEELYIHEKFRQNGGKALCLPWLKWGHRFGRPNGVPYKEVLTRWNKIRNYVLGHQELGLPLDRIHQHFCQAQPGARMILMPPSEWNQLLDDPVGNVTCPVPYASPKESGGGLEQPPAMSCNTLGELQAWARTKARDLDQHIPRLSEFASKCQHVTEITHRRESTIGLLSAPRLVSYQSERDPLVFRLPTMFPHLDLKVMPHLREMPTIEETDMLFLDTEGTYTRLWGELNFYHPKVKRFIAVHDTQLYSRKGEDGKEPTLKALTDFMQQHPEWSVIVHDEHQYGLTIIGCQDQDKPKLPSLTTMAVNLTKALAVHVADGMNTVSKEVYEQRLLRCTPCPRRNNDSCSVCGCGLTRKAALASSNCPLGYWHTGEVAPKEQGA